MFTEASLDEGVTSRIFLKAGVIDVTGNYSYMYLPSERKMQMTCYFRKLLVALMKENPKSISAFLYILLFFVLKIFAKAEENFL